MKHKLNHILPALRVHSWGGYGSQLFAAHAALNLQSKFPGRRLIIIIHTSGVTRRFSELNFTELGLKSRQIEDFESVLDGGESAPHTLNTILKIRSRLVKIIVGTFQVLRLVLYSNDDKTFQLIKPWTFALRGHYTRVTLERDSVHFLFKAILDGETAGKDDILNLAVHLRLGDLLSLPNKNPISVARVDRLTKQLKFDSTRAMILSDSSALEVKTFLLESEQLKHMIFNRESTLSTIRTCVMADQFIGTTSKISIWAAIFRYFIFQRESFLPMELSWTDSIGLEVTYY